MDELMLDWLYDELDEDSRKEVAAHVDGCARCAAEAGSLRRTREMFDELPGCAEPPASLTAILMHEAARQAPRRAVAAEPAESSGLWQRFKQWLSPIALHPAAAAVATLVLVAGVAGTLYVRSGSKMAETERRSDLAGPPPTAPGAAAGVQTEPESSTAADEAAPPPAEMAEAKEADDTAGRLGYQAGLVDSEAQQAIDQRAESMDRKKKPAEKPRRSKRADSSKGRTNGVAKGPVANAISGSDPLVDLDQGELRGGNATPPPATGASSTRGAVQSQSVTSSAPAAKQDTYRPYKDEPLSAKERAWLSKQQVSLEKLAADKRCQEAAKIANDILDRNPDFYTSEVARSVPVKNCAMYVKDETRRRATARSKAAGGAPAGTPAAPVKKSRAHDEAAAEPSR